ncbi:unnamed protein product [Trichobilharzia regenti]|nr:unnamed protein product [Trichobilharzia regenti]
MHRFAAFVPPTADRTPRLFPTPISWEKQIQTPLYLGWKPPVYSIEGWTEANDFNALPEERKRQLRTQLPHVPAPDPVTGLPRNPGGRTGVCGKGYLPLWGPNSALIFLVTKVSYSNPSGSGETSGDPFKFIGFKNPLCSQLPWVSQFMVDTAQFIHFYFIYICNCILFSGPDDYSNTLFNSVIDCFYASHAFSYPVIRVFLQVIHIIKGLYQFVEYSKANYSQKLFLLICLLGRNHRILPLILYTQNYLSRNTLFENKCSQ